MDFTNKFKEEVHARESARRGCFYEGLADVLVDEKSMKQVEKSVAKRKSSGGGRASNTNLPLMFFLKKIVSLVCHRRENDLWTEILVRGDYAGEMFEELEGRFPSEREIEKGEEVAEVVGVEVSLTLGKGERRVAQSRCRRMDTISCTSSTRLVTKEAIISVMICANFTKHRSRIERLNSEE